MSLLKTTVELRYLTGRLNALESAVKMMLTASPPRTHADVLEIMETEDEPSETDPAVLEGLRDGRRELIELIRSLRSLTP